MDFGEEGCSFTGVTVEEVRSLIRMVVAGYVQVDTVCVQNGHQCLTQQLQRRVRVGVVVAVAVKGKVTDHDDPFPIGRPQVPMQPCQFLSPWLVIGVHGHLPGTGSVK